MPRALSHAFIKLNLSVRPKMAPDYHFRDHNPDNWLILSGFRFNVAENLLI